jgi:AraC family cel operon transcriptional repressor
METRRFHIDDYLAPDEAFHLARKTLPPRFPKFAHDHDYFEVFLVESGQVQNWINGQMQTLDRGDLLFLRPRDLHRLRAVGPAPNRIINVMFRGGTVAHLVSRYGDDFGGRFFDSPRPVPRVHRLSGVALTNVIAAADKLQMDRRSLARIELFLLSLGSEIAHPREATEEKGPRWFADACRAVRQHELFVQGAPGLIKAAGRSHEHVCRTCKEVLGLTPSAFVNQVRIDYAARMLRSTDRSIREISDDCGIENLSHFYGLFRRQMGVTPRRFRMLYQGDPFEVV